MKKVVGMMVMMLLVAFTSQLSAQDVAAKGKAKRGGKEQKEQRLEDLQKLKIELALSDDQVTKIKALVDQRKANAGSNKDLDKEARKENMKKFNSELKSILTEEQFKKLNSKRKDKMKQRKDKDGSGK